MNPENMVALFSLIRLGHELDRLSDIIPYLEAYLEIDPGKHEVRYSLAGSLICLDKKDAAREQLDIILEADPAYEAAKEMLEQIQS